MFYEKIWKNRLYNMIMVTLLLATLYLYVSAGRTIKQKCTVNKIIGRQNIILRHIFSNSSIVISILLILRFNGLKVSLHYRGITSFHYYSCIEGGLLSFYLYKIILMRSVEILLL